VRQRLQLVPVLLALLALLLELLMPTRAIAAKRHDPYPLHSGSSGPRVAALQWLLAGHRPSVFTKTKPTFKGRPNGYYGARTKAAVKAMKYRIGFPKAGECQLGKTSTYVTDSAGVLLIEILEGKKQRPRCWVAIAAKRIQGTVVPGATVIALAIKRLELSQLGVHEIPDGSNRGPCISISCRLGDLGEFGPYQGSTGAYGAPWCASFGDWALKRIAGHGFGSANDAYVPTIAEYAQARGWLQAKPTVGSFVIFLSADRLLVNAYHIGYVIKLVGSSGIETVEGNYADAVHEVYRTFQANPMIYVDVPGVA
jgi:hypothetical protein